MEVDQKYSKGAGLFIEHSGQVYYFCMPECKQEFVKNPSRYAEERSQNEKSGKTARP